MPCVRTTRLQRDISWATRRRHGDADQQAARPWLARERCSRAGPAGCGGVLLNALAQVCTGKRGGRGHSWWTFGGPHLPALVSPQRLQAPTYSKLPKRTCRRWTCKHSALSHACKRILKRACCLANSRIWIGRICLVCMSMHEPTYMLHATISPVHGSARAVGNAGVILEVDPPVGTHGNAKACREQCVCVFCKCTLWAVAEGRRRQTTTPRFPTSHCFRARLRSCQLRSSRA